MTDTTDTPSLAPNTYTQAQWASMGLLCALLVVRTATLASPLPWWDANPLVMPPVMSGTGPGFSMAINALLLLASVLVLITNRTNATRADAIDAGLLALGAIPVFLHGWLLDGSLDARWLGSTWLAAMVGALVIRRLPDDHALRRVLFCTAGAVLAVLMVKGGFQILVEHPATVDDYRANKDRILAARGWSSGSHMARTFERRLMQPDPTAWFALTNVLASFLGAGLFMMGSLAIIRRRETTRPWLAIAIILAIACVIMLVLSRAKGAIAATALTGAAVGLLAVLHRRDAKAPGPLRFVTLACVLAGPTLILLQGIVGESLSNLSVLFRWFYMQGAVRIGLEHPLGVGPGGFQAAYLLARPELATEEVASPHALFLEYWATLGILGLSWVALLLRWTLAMGRPAETGSSTTTHDTDPGTEATGSRAVLVALVVGLLLAIRAEVGVLTPDTAILWIVMLAVGVGVGLVLWPATRATLGLAVIRWGGLGAGLLLLTHAQVEVTGTHASAAPLALALIGLAVPRPRAQRDNTGKVPIGLTAVAGLGALLTASAALNGMQWERQLRAAALELEPSAVLQNRFQQVIGSAEGRAALASELSDALGARVEPDPESLARSISALRDGVIEQAVEPLNAAIELEPTRWQVKRSLATLHLTRADAAIVQGRDAGPDLERAVALWGLEGPETPATAAELRAFATVLEARSSLRDDPADRARAIEVLERTMELDPYNLPIAMRLRNLYLEVGDASASRRWAQRALELDGFKRLDAEVRGLSSGDRASLETQVGGP